MNSSLGPVFDIVRPYLRGKVKRSGRDNIITICPFHDDRTPSFWLNISNGLWLCFSCGLRGSLQSFLKRSGVSRTLIDSTMEPIRDQLDAFRRQEKHKQQAKFLSDPNVGEVILPEALLGVYDYKPHVMVNAGFEPSLLRDFDIGYDRNKDRVTFPLRDLYGNLVGVSGRTTLSGGSPRYKVYRGGHRDEKGKYITGDFGENFDEEYRDFEVDSHRFLWNSHNAYPSILADSRGTEILVITEGFKACLWLVQHGFHTTVALTGASISEDQRNLIARMAGGPVVLFLDNDDPGRVATRREGKRLSKLVNDLWVAVYPGGKDAPDDLDQAQIRRAIYGSEDWYTWLRMNS